MPVSPPPGSRLDRTTRPGRRGRRTRRRRVAMTVVGALALCLVAAIAVALAIHPSARASGPAGRPSGSSPTTTVAVTTTQPPTTVPPPPTTDVGSLPQTGTFPTSASPLFEANMAALWQGVMTGSTAAARPAFFPESAYLQLKSIGDPSADYTGRLVADFDADLGAAHAQLGGDAATATLVSVDVPEQYGHWIPPGVCDNRVGYYEVANARVVYREDGEVRSFGIASLISWRGEWYVVHLGAILRSTTSGVVEDPELGPGSSPDSTTC